MSTFKIHDPEPGWQKRWPKDAFRLLVRTPEAFATFLVIMPVAGAIKWALAHSGLPMGLYQPIGHFLATTIGIIAVMVMCKAFYRKDGYASAPIGITSLRLPLFTNLIITIVMGFIGLLFLAIPGGGEDERAASLTLAQMIFMGHRDFFGFMITFMIGLWYSVPVLAAGGMSAEENAHVSKMIGDKIENLVPFYTAKMILSILFIFLVLGPLALFTGSFFVALIYVITKELYGGPGLREEEKKVVPNAVTAGA